MLIITMSLYMQIIFLEGQIHTEASSNGKLSKAEILVRQSIDTVKPNSEW
jgi:hypothetical protein